jgi:L-rhamnose mutarotase
MELQPGAEAVYKEKHDHIWPEMAQRLRDAGVRNYSIFRRGLALFAYLECDDPALMPGGTDPVVRRWWDMMAPYMVTTEDRSPRTEPLEEVFHLD